MHCRRELSGQNGQGLKSRWRCLAFVSDRGRKQCKALFLRPPRHPHPHHQRRSSPDQNEYNVVRLVLGQLWLQRRAGGLARWYPPKWRNPAPLPGAQHRMDLEE